MINHPWNMYPVQHVCHAGHCETPAENPPPGIGHRDVVHIANFAPTCPGRETALPAPRVRPSSRGASR